MAGTIPTQSVHFEFPDTEITIVVSLGAYGHHIWDFTISGLSLELIRVSPHFTLTAHRAQQRGELTLINL